MFDVRMRRLIDGPLNAAGKVLAARGVTADQVTVAAFAIGMAGAVAIAARHPLLGLALILLGRLGDGLDGAVARATSPSDRGGYLDIVLDFILYGSVPLAFAIADPGANALAAALLVGSFLANGSAFLAFAIMAQKRGMETRAQGVKSLFYVTGLVEGTETIACFVLLCLFPAQFAWIAGGMALLCYLSALARVLTACRVLN